MSLTRWAALAVAVLAVAVYANAAGNGFALDDQFIIENNERVHGIDRIPDAVSQPYWPGAPGRIGLYRPVTAASYAVEWELWGGDPAPFHITNILLHAVVTVLAFFLLHAFVGTAGAVAGAAVFAVHPVHVEAVANIVGRAELLAAAFVLVAALVYLRGDLLRSRARLCVGSAAIAVAYLLGLGSKEIAVTLPGLLVVLEAGRWRGAPGGAAARGEGGAWPQVTARLRARWPVYLLLAVALGAYLLVRSAVLGTAVGNDGAGFLRPLTSGERVLTAVSVWPEYLRLMVFPVHLVADYSPGVLMPVRGFDSAVLAGLLVGALAVLTMGYTWVRGRAWVIALGLIWFAVAVFPVSNLVIPVGVLLAERTLYLPSVGLALVVAGGWRWLAARRPAGRRVAAAVLAAIVGLAGARTWVRTPTWRTTETVLQTLARDHPESFRVQWLEAEELRSAGRMDEALRRFRYAVELVPAHYQLRMRYGQTLLETGRMDQAAAAFRAARDAVPDLAEAHMFLTAALLRTDRAEEAVAAARQGVRWHPDHRGAYHQLAIALTRTRSYQDALEARTRSIRLGGDRAATEQFIHQAELLLRLDRPEDAAAALDEARRRAPDAPTVPSLEALRQAIETADTAVLPYR